MELSQPCSSAPSGQSFHPSHSHWGWRHWPALQANWLGAQVPKRTGQRLKLSTLAPRC